MKIKLKHIVILITLLSFSSIVYGFSLEEEQANSAQKYIGLGTVGLFLVAMPLFLYKESKRKNMKDYMLNKDNIMKMRDKEGKNTQMSLRLRFAPIDIDGVAHRLKGVEGNPDGKDDVRLCWLVVHAVEADHGYEVVEKEPAVFEEPQKTEVCHHAQDEVGDSLFAHLLDFQPSGGEPVHCRGNPQKNDKRRIPGGVEDIAGHKKEDLLGLPGSEGVVETQQDRKKDHE